MNEIIRNQTPPATGIFFQYSVPSATVAAMFMAAMIVTDNAPRQNPTPTYLSGHEAPTFSFTEETLFLSEVSDMQTFAQEIASIYADLAARQKPLGREFDVEWDEYADLLYES